MSKRSMKDLERRAVSLAAYGLVLASVLISCTGREAPSQNRTPHEPTAVPSAPADEALPEIRTLEITRTPALSIQTPPAVDDGRGFHEAGETDLTERINAARTEAGLPALAVHAGLTGAARLRAMESEKSGRISHTRPDGRTWLTVLETEFPVECLERGEAIAYTAPEQAVHPDADAWYASLTQSPTQQECLLHPDAQSLGVGIYFSCRDGHYAAAAVVLVGTEVPEVRDITGV